ncbi:MAG TPA: zinc-binding dehydrogenase [Candidatus Eisenbacteria bacterium]|nr:zinc-binding dehydrogenase [Candidatus Eisenbacteria bacterium]
MKAIRIHKFGATEEALQFDDIPVPEPRGDQVLIQVEAAALNRADLGLRRGTYRISPEELPVIPGREFAGPIAKVGPEVKTFTPGQRVVAYTGTGGYAEYALAKVSEVCPLPDGMESVTAAVVPTVFLTAWFALLSEGKLKTGEWVLVQAGSSGVGMAAIQIAKHVGAKVVATSSGDEKCRRVRRLGADAVIDYTKTDFAAEVERVTGARGVDVVLEMIGGEVYRKSLETLAPGGRLVSIGGAFGAIPDSPPALGGGRSARRFSITNHLKARPQDFGELANILKLVSEKKFQVVIDKVFPLADARAAQRYLEAREHFGKIVLVP